MKNLNKLTVIIVTYKTNKDILLNCLNSINKSVETIIIENSRYFKDKNKFLKKFPNLRILCSGSNLGYGAGNNIGFNKSKTNYNLVINPDIVCDKNLFTNIDKILNSKKNFSIIGCQYLNDKTTMPAGFFDKTKNKEFKKSFFSKKQKIFNKVDWVTGCSMLINLEKFKDRNVFDENYFLFFEEFDLCKKVLKNNGLIFSSSNLKVHHLGFKGSFGADNSLLESATKVKNWHFMWSSFYFYRKNYNYFYALFKVSGKLFRSFFKLIFYSISFNTNKKNKYLYRFLGLMSGLITNKSFYRDTKLN